jgi:two-component system, NarL family, captular synthesis response regulator RcsB
MDDFCIRVVVADDHPSVIAGLKATLGDHATVKVVASAANSTELIGALNANPCDVLISDYAMPNGEFGDGITLFSFLRRRYPDTRIVVLTMMDNPGVIRALLKLGIQCILSKSDATAHVLAAIHGAYADGRYFSPAIAKIVWQLDVENPMATKRALTTREEEVVRLFVEGKSVNDIATVLKRSKQTISSQKTNAMKKLGIDNDTDLIKYHLGLKLASTDAPSPRQNESGGT